jgi:hypothetical protein
MLPETGTSSTAAPSKAIVVMLSISGAKHGPVAVIRDFRRWKEWFKRKHLMPGEEVRRDNCEYLEIYSPVTGWKYLYYPTKVLMYPEGPDVSGDAADRQQSSGA